MSHTNKKTLINTQEYLAKGFYIYQLIYLSSDILMQGKTLVAFKSKNLDRFPRLDTVLMVEKAIYKYKSDKTITEIWKKLPKKVMWTTFTTILDYLEYSGKIYLEDDKTITWLWDPKGIESLKKKNLMIEVWCRIELIR